MRSLLLSPSRFFEGSVCLLSDDSNVMVRLPFSRRALPCISNGLSTLRSVPLHAEGSSLRLRVVFLLLQLRDIVRSDPGHAIDLDPGCVFSYFFFFLHNFLLRLHRT